MHFNVCLIVHTHSMWVLHMLYIITHDQYLYMFVHHCIWVFTHVLYKYVKLGSVATFAAPCTACGMWSGHSRCGENLLLELLALIRCNRACMGGLSCSCECVCEQWCL